MSSRTLRAVAIGVAAVVIVFLAVRAFNGNNDKSSTTTTSASQAQTWAENACSALVTWKADVVAAAGTIKQSPTRDTAKKAVDDAKTATHTLTDSLSGLGAPGTTAGTQAQATLDSLKTQMQTGVSTLQEAAGKISGLSGSVDAIATISTTLVTMGDQVTAAGTALRNLPTGELQDAVATAPSCVKLQNGSSS